MYKGEGKLIMFSELVPYLNVSKYKRTKKYVKTKLMIRIFSNKKYFSFFYFPSCFETNPGGRGWGLSQVVVRVL